MVKVANLPHYLTESSETDRDSLKTWKKNRYITYILHYITTYYYIFATYYHNGPWLIDHIPTWPGYGMAPGSLDFSRRLVDACRWLRPFEERSLWIVNSHIHCMNLRAEAKSLRRRFPSAVHVSETFFGVPSWKLAQTGVCLSDLSRLMFIDIRSALQLNQPYWPRCEQPIGDALHDEPPWPDGDRKSVDGSWWINSGSDNSFCSTID